MLGYLAALVIGLSLGLLGGGGSILTVPALIYLLGYGVKVAVPMSLVVVGLTALFGCVRHYRAKNVDLGAALAFGPLAIAGAFGGAALGIRVSARLQITIFAVVMLLAATTMLFGQQRLLGRWFGVSDHRTPRSLPAMALLGGAVGVLTGFVGVGGGFLYVPALVLVGGVNMRKAVGTSLVLIAMSCAAGVAKYLGAVTLPWAAVAAFTALAFVGVGVGSALVHRVSQDMLRRGFAVFLFVMGAFVLWQGEGRARGTSHAAQPVQTLEPTEPR